MNPGNLKVWVCMSCKVAHFSANRDYAECIHDGHAMYVGVVCPVEQVGEARDA